MSLGCKLSQRAHAIPSDYHLVFWEILLQNDLESSSGSYSRGFLCCMCTFFLSFFFLSHNCISLFTHPLTLLSMGQQIQLQFSSNILKHNSYGLNSFKIAKTFLSISSCILGSHDTYSHYFYFLLERWKQKNNIFLCIILDACHIYSKMRIHWMLYCYLITWCKFTLSVSRTWSYKF